MRYNYLTENTCSQMISFDLNDSTGYFIKCLMRFRQNIILGEFKMSSNKI